MVWLEGNMSLKNPVTPPGIDPGTVRLGAQRLNHYATPGPNLVATGQTANDDVTCISAYNEGNSMDHYTLYFMRIRYSNIKFGSDWSIMKGTLLGQQISYLSVFWILLDEILWMYVLINLHTSAINTAWWVAISQ